MKTERTHFDNQIRQALEGHSTAPSPALRDALMARLAAAPPRKAAWYRRSSTRWLAAAVLLIPVSIILYFLFIANPGQPEPASVKPEGLSSTNPKQTENEAPSTPESTNAGAISIDPKTVEETNESLVVIPSAAPVANHPAVPLNPDPQIDNNGLKKLEPLDNIAKNNTSEISQIEGTRSPETPAINNFQFGLTPVLSTKINVIKATLPLPAFVTVSKTAKPRLAKEDIPSQTHYTPYHRPVSVGFSYTPEIMFNVLDDDSKFVHNASLDILFHFHDFSIRTGAGLAFAKGSSAIAVEYNPYKGSYQHLDSLDFVYDMHSEQLVAVYHTSERSVYDSVAQDAISKIDKEYTYLQIPLIFGYKFFEKERFGLSVNAGPTLSILLDTKETSDFDPGKNLIINTTTLSPDRIKTNWQFGAGLGFGYHLTPRLAFEIEPRVKYYFNSVYEKAATIRKPWSFELRGGVLYTF